MGKNPAFQFYPADWTRDLHEHPLEVEGFWIRVCCQLWWSETRGSLTKSLSKWSRITGISSRKCKLLFAYLLKQNIADIQIDNNTYTVTSRRMVRDEHIRHVRSLAGSLGGNPNIKGYPITSDLLKQNNDKTEQSLVKLNLTPSSSSSTIKKEYILSPDTGNGSCPHLKIIDLYHELLPQLPKVKMWTDGRNKTLQARWKESKERQSLEWWQKYFDIVVDSPFLLGENDRKFRADLEWLIQIRNMPKVLEGKYMARKEIKRDPFKD